MSFNPHLLFAVYLLVISMTVVLFFAWRSNREVQGLKEWFFAYISAFVNITIFISNVLPNAFLFMLLNNGTLMATGFFAFKGCCRHMGIQSRLEPVAVPIIISMLCISVYFTLIDNNLAIRFLLSSLMSGIFFIAGAFYLQRGHSESYPFRYLFAIVLFLHGLFNILRSGLFSSPLSMLLDIMAISPTDLILYEQLLMTSLAPLGVVMLTNEVISLQLREYAEHDSLTNLYNRRIFLELLKKCKSLATRSNTPLSLLILDIDHFKTINDRFGHLAGDQVLIDFAEKIQTNLRKEDVIGRMGGEEFAIFLPNIPKGSAIAFAERLRFMIESTPAATSKGIIHYTVSIGVTNIHHETTLEQALDAADAAMYEAKRNGRNQSVYKDVSIR